VTAENPAIAERTQIVVQWLLDPHRSVAAADLDLQDVWSAEDTLDRESAGLFEVEGHDIAMGSANVFLSARDPEATVARIVEILGRGLLRDGVRIGVAQTTTAARPARAYRPVYPPGLEKFEIG